MRDALLCSLCLCVLSAQPGPPMDRFRHLGSPARQWAFVLETLQKYRDDCRRDVTCEIFSASMYATAVNSYKQRIEIGPNGYAGDFVRYALLVTAADIAANRKFWVNRFTPEQIAEAQEAIRTKSKELMAVLLVSVLLAGDDAPALIEEAVAIHFADTTGNENFARHLGPAFEEYAFGRFGGIASSGESDAEVARHIDTEINSIRREHLAQFERALTPAIEQALAAHPLLETLAPRLTRFNAADLREKKFLAALDRLRKSGRITKGARGLIAQVPPELPALP